MRRGPAGQPLSAEYIFSCVSAELPVVLEVSNYREAVDDVEMSLRNGHIPGLGLPRLRSQAAVAGNEMYCTILLSSSPPWEAPPPTLDNLQSVNSGFHLNIWPASSPQRRIILILTYVQHLHLFNLLCNTEWPQNDALYEAASSH